MKLSVSNIAWEEKYDSEMYKYLSNTGFAGLEIAPTRIAGIDPYDKLKSASEFKKMLSEQYGLCIPSMQSIWFSKTQRLFGTALERKELNDYTKKAILFAQALECKNLVFGCPRNRKLSDDGDKGVADEFFTSVATYADMHNTVFSVEANPPIYDTDFITDSFQAFELVKRLNAKGLMVNYDLGTAICNGEDLTVLKSNLSLVNHIHISEPHLALIQKRDIHKQLADILKKGNYDGFVSVEMATIKDINEVKKTLEYIKREFE